MRLGKRERQERKDRNKALEACRARVHRVMHPDVNDAACGGAVSSPLGHFWPSNKAKPRVPAGWNAGKARSLAQAKGKAYS